MSAFVDAHARDVDRADAWSDAMRSPPGRPPRLITIDLNEVPAAIAESVRAVLSQRGLLEAIEAVDPTAFKSLFRELGNNVACVVAMCEPYDDEQEAA